MAKFDHHVHTSQHSPDSIIDARTLVERIRACGLDGVAITDHDYQWKREELAELAAYGAERGVRVFGGAEISAIEGHFLVYGLENLDDVPPGVRLKDLLKVVVRQNGAIVAAHPYRWDQDFDEIVEEHGPVFHGIELVSNNVTPGTRAKAERLLSRHKMGRTGSSDGHEPEIVACYYTEFPGTIESLADFVAAIRSGAGKPRHRAGAPSAAGAVDEAIPRR
jgi:predicted metal-dependent phosphoesterase TrpH